MRCVALILLTAGVMQAQNPVFDRFFDEYFFHFYPTQGTSAGFHQYDTQLEDYTKAGVDQRIGVLHKFEREVQAVPQSDDRDMVLAKIHSDLLELENIRQWEKNPDVYSSGVTASIFTLMSRNFAPQPGRLRSVIARERLIPPVFNAARANLKNPPKIYTEIAIEQLPGLISFFDKDVPLAFTQVHDQKLLADFKASNQNVMNALKSYEAYLKNDLLPKSHGDFRIGAENYHKKLEYDEMVDTPLDELLKIGYQNLHQNQEWFQRVARQIDPKKTPQQILAEARNGPPRSRSTAQRLSQYSGRPAGFHHSTQDREDPLARASDSGGNASLRAGHHVCFHGHARTL